MQGASLRSLPLVRGAGLAVLTDPLVLLRAGPPSLEALGESVGRVTGAPSGVRRGAAGAAPAPVHRNVSWAPAAVAPTSGGAAAPRWRSATMPESATGEQHLSAASPAAGRRPAGDQRSQTPGDVRAMPPRANQGPAPLRPDLAGAIPARPAPSGPGAAGPTGSAAVGSITAAALETAARAGHGTTGTTPPGTSGTPATAPVERLTDERSGSAAATPPVGAAASAATSLAASSRERAPASVFGGGVLDELLGRWEDSTRRPEAPSPTAPAARSPFAPLATPETTGFVAPDRGTDAPADDVSLDQVEVALGELLRREVEQYGLEGGLV